MDINVIELVLLALTVSYLTHILLLEEKTSHFGPFQNKDRIVYFKNAEDGDHTQPVALFDWVRRPFGVYRVEKHIWYVNETASERWTCPVCLSFWVALAVLLLRFVVPDVIFMQVLLLFALAAFASIVNVNLLGQEGADYGQEA